jgi:hypothetical protein
MAPIVAATPWSEPGHELLAQFRVRALHTNNQVNPGQRASKRFDPYWSHLKGLYGGLHFTLALLLLICVDEVPPPRSRPTTVRHRGTGGYHPRTSIFCSSSFSTLFRSSRAFCFFL